MAVDKDKRIMIVTFSRCNNLGGTLQEYALFSVLKSYGRVKCLDYLSESVAMLSKPIRGGFIKKAKLMTVSAVRKITRRKSGKQNEEHHYSLLLNNPRLLINQVIGRFYIMISDIIHYKQRKEMLRNFYSFQEKYVQYTDCFTNEQLQDNEICDRLFRDYGICISGSDQIWNPSYAGASPVYFLDFVPRGITKASYASSFGNYKFTSEALNERIAAYLRDFVCISVRESYSVTHLKEKCNIQSQCVLDPTLLLTKTQWCNGLNIQRSEKPPYLLVYVLGDRRTLIPFAKRIAKHLGLEVKIIGTKFLLSFARGGGVEYFPSTGPREFISLYSQAAFVVTNSFHGTAFSVNFNIPFFTVSSLVNERVRSFLEIVGLSDRLVSDCRSCDLELTEMDFADANRLLEQERKRSIDYLEKAIGTDYEVGDEL